MSESDNRKHWAEQEERGSLWGIMFLLYSFKFLGATVCKIFMSPVLLYFYLFNQSARTNLKYYLVRLNQYHIGMPKPSQWHILKIFFNFGFGVVDKMSAWQGKVSRFKMTKINSELFLKLQEQGQGAVIMVSHLGNFEVSRMASNSYKNTRFNVFMHTKNARKFSQVIKKFNPEFAMSVIQGDALNMQLAIELKEKVDAGEFVVIAGDRVPVKNETGVVTVDFLGEAANFPIGPYVLAKVLNCPLLGIFCTKKGKGYQVVFESYAEKIAFNRNNREEVIKGYAQTYAHSIEQQLKSAPLQWYNFHPFWNSQ
ncbi:MAG: hypothetical protein R3E90_10905 [Marinicella sp.]|nr:hypothetical protein [Xanthomonadales bacterium]